MSSQGVVSSAALSRRRLLHLGAVGVLGWAGCPFTRWLASPSFAALAAQPVGSRMLEPDAVGTLSHTEHERLWSLFESIRTWWSLDGPEPDMGRRRAWFAEAVALKVELRPSYLGEYRSAARLVEACCERRGSNDELAPLFATSFSRADPVATRLDHLRHYVVTEFIQLHVIAGGLLSFGYGTYPGYQAGPLIQRPYR